MTTYNGEPFIAPSIDSVLAQTWPDLELIVVDDGSTDATPQILCGYRDKRVRVIRQSRNGGIVAARNVAFASATGALIAALDHDDLSHPERLAMQVAYLEAHPKVVLLGTEVGLRTGKRIVVPDHPIAGDPLALRWLLHVDNPLTWSSIMLRADAVHQLGCFMRPEFELADDFDLYHRLLGIGDIARLDAVLTTYRYHSSNASTDNARRLDTRAAEVLAAAYAHWLGDDAWMAAESAVRHWFNRRPPRDAATLDGLGRTLVRLLAGFCAAGEPGSVAPERITTLAAETWWRTVRSAVRAGAPWLASRWRAYPRLAAEFQPSHRDVAASIAAGLVRLLDVRH